MSGGVGKGRRASSAPRQADAPGAHPGLPEGEPTPPAPGRERFARPSAWERPGSGRAPPVVTELFILTLHPRAAPPGSVPASPAAHPRAGGGAKPPGEESASGRARSRERLCRGPAGRQNDGSRGFLEVELCWGAGVNPSRGVPRSDLAAPSAMPARGAAVSPSRTPLTRPRGPRPEGQHTHQLDALGKGVVLPVLLRETLEYLSLSIPTPCRDKRGIRGSAAGTHPAFQPPVTPGWRQQRDAPALRQPDTGSTEETPAPSTNTAVRQHRPSRREKRRF